MPRVDPATLEHLDEHGYCTVPGVVDEATAAQVRAMMDEFLGPACDHIDVVGRGMQKGTMWPERTAAEGGRPLLTEEGPYMHSLQHPIPDARTALPVEPLAEVMSEVLRCNSVDDLVLVHQNLGHPSNGPLSEPLAGRSAADRDRNLQEVPRQPQQPHHGLLLHASWSDRA